MTHGNGFKRVTALKNNYLYNDGAERIDDLDLGVDMTLYRVYDPILGRWWQQDPLSDLPQQVAQSPYQYGWNNPIRYNDPNGDCPCIIPAIPWIITAIETAVAAGTVATAGYLAYEQLGPNYDKLRTGTVQPVNEGLNIRPKPDKNQPPNWNNFKKSARIVVALGIVARLVERHPELFGGDKKQVEQNLVHLSPEELEFFIQNGQGLLRSGENDLTDRQIFGTHNPSLLNAATIYNFNKDGYSLELGLSEEQQAAREEEQNKGRKAMTC